MRESLDGRSRQEPLAVEANDDSGKQRAHGGELSWGAENLFLRKQLALLQERKDQTTPGRRFHPWATRITLRQ